MKIKRARRENAPDVAVLVVKRAMFKGRKRVRFAPWMRELEFTIPLGRKARREFERERRDHWRLVRAKQR